MMDMRYRVLLISLGLAGAFVCPAQEPMVVEQIIAKVNGDIITRTEIDRLRHQAEAELRQRGANPQQIAAALKEREPNLLRDKIDEMLLIQRGKELNINVDQEVSKYLASIQLENKIADPEKFQQWIREQLGMSFEDFRAAVKNGMLRQRVIGQEVGSRINIPRSEIEAYYEKNKNSFVRQEQIFLREILVSTAGKDEAGKAAAEKKAKDLVARARRGERFAELVRDNSDAATAKEGGNLGAWKKGELDPRIEALVWDKPRGHVTDPIEVPAGWLILRVDEHFREGQATLEEVENEIRDRLFMPQFEPKVREYLTQLRMDAFLEIRDGYVDTGAAPGKDTRWTDPAMLRPVTVTKEEVANQFHRKRLLWTLPIPGTLRQTASKSTSK
jgi:parvulin-like peptidyl-prolyl isomerase